MKKYIGAAVLLFFFLLFVPILACLGEGFAPKSNQSDSSKTQNINADDTFDLLDESTGEIITVSARDYLLGAVASEMPPSFHSEALKAQAAASTTLCRAVRLKPLRSIGEMTFPISSLPTAQEMLWRHNTKPPPPSPPMK